MAIVQLSFLSWLLSRYIYGLGFSLVISALLASYSYLWSWLLPGYIFGLGYWIALLFVNIFFFVLFWLLRLNCLFGSQMMEPMKEVKKAYAVQLFILTIYVQV